MKLRNKETGEIGEPFGIACVNGRTFVQFDDGKGTFKFEVHSLAELNEKWEDYEEPKEYWYVSCAGKVEKATTDEDDYNESHISGHISIDNYFGSKEEAEKAIKKLNALKRLKDKGFRFFGNITLGEYGNAKYRLDYPATSVEEADLDLLFGGEEC